MKRLRKTGLFVCLLLLGQMVSLGLAADIVANPRNSEKLDEESLKLMLTGKEKFWESGSEVKIAFLKSDPRIDELLTRYSGMTSNKFKNHWQRIAFSGRGKMPKTFARSEDLIAYVKANKGAIAIVSSLSEAGDLREIDFGWFDPEGRTVFYASN